MNKNFIINIIGIILLLTGTITLGFGVHEFNENNSETLLMIATILIFLGSMIILYQWKNNNFFDKYCYEERDVFWI